MVVDGLQHEFIECIFNKEVFSFIFDVFRGENIEIVSLNSKKTILKLDFERKGDEILAERNVMNSDMGIYPYLENEEKELS